MIDVVQGLKRSLQSIVDGEVTEGYLVRPVLLGATRQLDELFEEVWAARCLLNAAKENFAMGWEPEYLESGDDD